MKGTEWSLEVDTHLYNKSIFLRHQSNQMREWKVLLTHDPEMI